MIEAETLFLLKRAYYFNDNSNDNLRSNSFISNMIIKRNFGVFCFSLKLNIVAWCAPGHVGPTCSPVNGTDTCTLGKSAELTHSCK